MSVAVGASAVVVAFQRALALVPARWRKFLAANAGATTVRQSSRQEAVAEAVEACAEDTKGQKCYGPKQRSSYANKSHLLWRHLDRTM